MLLSNENIKLRAPEISDLEILFDIENNVELWHLSNTIAPYSRFDLEQYIMSVDKDIYKTSQLRLMIEGAENEVVGVVDLFDFDPVNKRAGVGIIVLEEKQNRGYASNALELLSEYADKKLNIHQLYCNIEVENTASISLFEKAGFIKSGLKKEWNYKNGIWTDELFLQKILNQNKL
ncbi:MAG: GNAT family N-acetyltransferase [Marinilabiliales bacterium]|nr:MAG: GNAT family N-acetyltransferase [Marinilabiliales bacterium]